LVDIAIDVRTAGVAWQGAIHNMRIGDRVSRAAAATTIGEV
jgi:hypothetical protein